MNKYILRFFIVLYPFLAGALYYFALYGPYKEYGQLQDDLQALDESESAREAEQMAAQARAEQLQRVREFLAGLHIRAENSQRNDVPVYLGEAATRNHVEFTELTLRQQVTNKGYGFLQMELHALGPFDALVSLLTELEEKETRYIAVDEMRITPTAVSGIHRLESKVDFLSNVPWTMLAAAPPPEPEPEGGEAAETAEPEGPPEETEGSEGPTPGPEPG